MVEAGKARI